MAREMIEEERRICDLLRGCCRALPLYKEEHDVYAFRSEVGMNLGYFSARLEQQQGAATFGIQLQGGICYMATIQRGNGPRGYGGLMMKVIEEFCKKAGCRKIIASAAGKSPEKYESWGFKRAECTFDEGFSVMEKEVI